VGAPATNDTATFGATGQGTVNLAAVSNRLNGMTIGAGTTYQFTGSAIRFNAGTTLTNNGTATFDSLSAFGGGTLTLAGSGTSVVKAFGTDGGVGPGTLTIASSVKLNATSPLNATNLQVVTNGALDVGAFTTAAALTVTDGDISGPGDGVTYMDVTANGVYLNGGTTTMYIKNASLYDQINSASGATPKDLAYGGILDLDLSILAGNKFVDYTQYQLFTFDPTSVSGDLSGIAFTNAGSTPYSSLTWSGPVGGVWTSTETADFRYFTFDQNTGVLMIVPEPSTIVFAGLGIGMAGWSAWRKRRLAKVLAKK